MSAFRPLGKLLARFTSGIYRPPKRVSDVDSVYRLQMDACPLNVMLCPFVLAAKQHHSAVTSINAVCVFMLFFLSMFLVDVVRTGGLIFGSSSFLKVTLLVSVGRGFRSMRLFEATCVE